LICKLCEGTTTKPNYVLNRLGEQVPLCKGCFLLLEVKTILAFFNASLGELVKELKKANFDFALDSTKKLLSSGIGEKLD